MRRTPPAPVVPVPDSPAEGDGRVMKHPSNGYTPVDKWTKRQAGDTDEQVSPPWREPSIAKVAQEVPESKETWQV